MDEEFSSYTFLNYSPFDDSDTIKQDLVIKAKV